MRLVVLRTPLATARIFPEPWVMIVTMRSASPSLMRRRTTPCSLYSGIGRMVPPAPPPAAALFLRFDEIRGLRTRRIQPETRTRPRIP